jgi:hypothetical protein
MAFREALFIYLNMIWLNALFLMNRRPWRNRDAPWRWVMKSSALILILAIVLLPAISDARCRTVGESASLATEYGTFPLYPSVRLVEVGHKRHNIPLQMLGYGLAPPLFVLAASFAIVGAGVGTVLHPVTKCMDAHTQVPWSVTGASEPQHSNQVAQTGREGQ